MASFAEILRALADPNAVQGGRWNPFQTAYNFTGSGREDLQRRQGLHATSETAATETAQSEIARQQAIQAMRQMASQSPEQVGLQRDILQNDQLRAQVPQIEAQTRGLQLGNEANAGALGDRDALRQYLAAQGVQSPDVANYQMQREMQDSNLRGAEAQRLATVGPEIRANAQYAAELPTYEDLAKLRVDSARQDIRSKELGGFSQLLTGAAATSGLPIDQNIMRAAGPISPPAQAFANMTGVPSAAKSPAPSIDQYVESNVRGQKSAGQQQRAGVLGNFGGEKSLFDTVRDDIRGPQAQPPRFDSPGRPTEQQPQARPLGDWQQPKEQSGQDRGASLRQEMRRLYEQMLHAEKMFEPDESKARASANVNFADLARVKEIIAQLRQMEGKR